MKILQINNIFYPRKVRIAFIFIFTMILTACGISEDSDRKRENKTPIEIPQKSWRNFAPPAIPPNIVTQEGQSAYLAEHYWDNLDLKDTTLLADKEKLQRVFINYIYVVSTQDIETANSYIEKFMRQISPYASWVREIMRIAEFYLFEINSPIVNEAMYVPFAKTALESGVFNELERERLTYQKNVSLKNNLQKKATNFSFIDREGKQRWLYDTVKRNTILMFSDPECDGCTEAAYLFSQDNVICQLLAQGTLDLIMIYTEGNKEVWKRMQTSYPSTWTLGFDKDETIKNEELYVLRAMPSIYFINQECIVFLKDKPADVIIGFIKDHVKPRKEQ